MKKIKNVIFLFIFFILISGICFAAPKIKLDPLDAAIRETSDYLNTNLPKGSKIIILNIQSDSPALSDYINYELITNAVNDKRFSIVDRHQLDSIRTMQDFQFSQEIADNKALEIGKIFKAQTIVSGALESLGKTYRLRVRALDAETNLVQGQFNRNIAASELINLIKGADKYSTSQTTSAGITIVNLTSKSIETIVMIPTDSTNRTDLVYLLERSDKKNLNNGQSRTFNIPQNIKGTQRINLRAVGDIRSSLFNKSDVEITQGLVLIFTRADDMYNLSPSAQVYNIGDTGPAGGIIFYDKENNSGGWRYLEAAPLEAEFQAPRSTRSTNVENLQAAIGSGRRNTQLITDAYSKAAGEWDTAAQKCAELTFGGFNDWFLPSKDELDQMYGNLKRRNLGDFKDDYYWSSTFDGSIQNFRNGGSASIGWGNSYSWTSRLFVRPIRQVVGPPPKN